MTNDDLRRLIDAHERDNSALYHGDLKEGTVAALKELEALRDIADDMFNCLRLPRA